MSRKEKKTADNSILRNSKLAEKREVRQSDRPEFYHGDGRLSRKRLIRLIEKNKKLPESRKVKRLSGSFI